MKSTGKGAIILPYGVLFRGNLKEKGFEGRLIPKSLIIGEYFKVEQTDIENLEAKRDEIIRNYEELFEEHSGEDGLLLEVIDDGKIKTADLKARINVLRKKNK